MQVKKFEAKSMKEALELVKANLGPEAIILSAKDSHRGFGLMGERSVEVTAAVSEETLRKKKIAESKLRDEMRSRFQQIPASKQKEFIQKVFKEKVEGRELVSANGAPVRGGSQQRQPSRQGVSVNMRSNNGGYPTQAQERVSVESRAQVKGLRYIDIEDEGSGSEAARERGNDRVRKAAERARSAGLEVFQEPKRPQPATRQNPQAPAAQGQTHDIAALESQVRELKTLIEKFQQVPQIPMSMHPGAEQGLPFELSAMYQRLTSQGVQPNLVTAMLRKAQRELDAQQIKKPSSIDAWVVRHVMNTTEAVANPTQGRYHVFMGCTGQGKTTTLVKFASHLILKEKKTIAIISLDTHKLGAADQLRLYAQILNVPFAVVRSPEEWRIAQTKLAKVHHILVDCPGSNLRSMDEVEWIKQMIPPAEYDRRIHYVQSVLARDEETLDIASRYQMIGFHDVIFTRLDESSRQGLILNFQERFRVPIHSFGLGSRIPEDFEFATKERVVDFLFKLSRVAKREDVK